MTTTLETPKTHSYSRLDVFTKCPLAYRLQYIDKMPTEDSDALEIGAAAHEFFQEWVEEGKPELVGQGDYLEKLAAECFQKTARNQSNFKDYLEICKTFAKSYKPNPDYPVSKCEIQMAFDEQWKKTDWFASNVRFRMKIDRLDLPDNPLPKKVVVVDYKTGFAGSIDSFQLDNYALGVSLLYPSVDQIEVRFYYVKSGFVQTKLLEVKDLDVTKIQLEALMERINDETKWKAKPGVKCLNCSVAAHCTQKPSNLKAISSLELAEAFAEEIAFLEAQSKAKKKALKAWVEKNGVVEAGGLAWNSYPMESMHVDMGPFLSACVSYKVDPAEVLNPDSKAIKKACKDVPGFSEAIQPYTGVDISTRFYGKKSAGDDE